MEDKRPEIRKSGATHELNRRESNQGFVYPFGAYPEEPCGQETGYDSKFIREDNCFYYQVIVSRDLLEKTFLRLIQALPAKVSFVVKIHSEDFYRDHDTYLSEEKLDREECLGWMTEWADVVFDDGFFGVGLFSEASGSEVFIDEHKTIHLYHRDPELIERMLDGLNIPFIFELPFFWDQSHYHEPLPLSDQQGDDYLTAFENLADNYELTLEEEDEETLNHSCGPVGMTCWKVDVRGNSSTETGNRGFYASLRLNAASRAEAIDLAEEFLEERGEHIELVLQMARTPFIALASEVSEKNPDPERPCVWLESDRIEFDWVRGPRHL